ncbi:MULTISPECIES: glucosamine-6-phosphate deaminase [Mumia]|uniref:glucosamine-6-phosphate deaminase n=1 Tax=Mumia TaxID=1546255 RepID=UPI001FB92BEA|nr:glucosamine-6-phosphate deaminase [Mumia sp. ZJ430]
MTTPPGSTVRHLVRDDAGQVADTAADLILDVLETDSAVGLATGSSPLGAYQEIVRRVRLGATASPVARRGFLLDEYLGLPAGDPNTYASVIRREVADALGLDVRGPDGQAADPEQEAERYGREVVAASVAVQVLGIGRNGHLGFNEPGSSLDSQTRVVRLTESTRRDNARFFDSPADVPTHAITQGLATLMQARRLVLIALGERKAEAVHAALHGPVDPACPASVLQRHPDAYVVTDREAAAAVR